MGQISVFIKIDGSISSRFFHLISEHRALVSLSFERVILTEWGCCKTRNRSGDPSSSADLWWTPSLRSEPQNTEACSEDHSKFQLIQFIISNSFCSLVFISPSTMLLPPLPLCYAISPVCTNLFSLPQPSIVYDSLCLGWGSSLFWQFSPVQSASFSNSFCIYSLHPTMSSSYREPYSDLQRTCVCYRLALNWKP